MNGDQLKHWRAREGLTQAQAAERLGVGRSSVQKWERDASSEIPKWAALAVAAVNGSLPPYED